MTAATEFSSEAKSCVVTAHAAEIRRVVVTRSPVRSRTLWSSRGLGKAKVGSSQSILAESAGTEVRLNCTLTEFHALEEAEETHFVTGAADRWARTGTGAVAPLFMLGGMVGGIGMGGMGMVASGWHGWPGLRGWVAWAHGPETITEDRVPEARGGAWAACSSTDGGSDGYTGS